MNEFIRKQFKILRGSNYRYLDAASMTPAPSRVVKAVQEALDYRGNPNRSAHPLAQRSERLLRDARATVADFIGASPDEIVFTKNTTDSINLAVEALSHRFEEGDIIALSTMEHHSNMLPYTKLRARGVHTKIIPLAEDSVRPEDVIRTLTPKTKMVAVAHCSNVLGTINDVAAIGKAVKEYNPNIIFIVDGAQAVAHLPVDVTNILCDMYAFSGHKMYGPDSIGVLYLNKKIHPYLMPVRAGGGTVNDVAITRGHDHDLISVDYDGSLSMLEGGTPNVSGASGLAEAIRFLRSIGIDKIRAHEIKLTQRLIDELNKIDKVLIHGHKDARKRVGLVSIAVVGVTPKELGTYLGNRNICIRYGAHCAFPLANELGHETLRFSIGVYNTEEDIELVVREIKQYIAECAGESKNVLRIKNIVVPKNEVLVRSVNAIEQQVKELSTGLDSEVLIMGGHFLGIPDFERNTFYPSIASLVPARLQSTLEEFGMATFPLATFEMAAELAGQLKHAGKKAKIFIIANDTTGINELRLSAANAQGKAAEQYRNELLAAFAGAGGVPDSYLKMLGDHGLTLDDLLSIDGHYFVRESHLRARFKNLVSKNKTFFKGLIDYRATDESVDVAIKVLDDSDIKTCTFDTFHSKTGGTFCIVEVAGLLAELCGNARNDLKYVSQKIVKPKMSAISKTVVMFTPSMCDGAVTRGAELFAKLFQPRAGEFGFLNVPLGPSSSESLKAGVRGSQIRSAMGGSPN